jgi:ABC-type multidrug transport system ATPase subunit
LLPPPKPATGALALDTYVLTKRFGSFTAMDQVSMRVEPGTVHALLGENGAGKSTLVKCVAGFQRAEEGSVLIDGREQDISSPIVARALGIGMVYQHFTLAPGMTVAENLLLVGQLPAVIDWRAKRAELQAFLATTPFRLDLDARPSELAAGEKQKLELLKQLYLKPRLLILDEPTSVLTPQEADEVLGHVRDFARSGQCTVLIITHKFREVMAYADNVTVLRRGKAVHHCSVAHTDPAALATAMMGSAAPDGGPVALAADGGHAGAGRAAGGGNAAAPAGPPALQVQHRGGLSVDAAGATTWVVTVRMSAEQAQRLRFPAGTWESIGFHAAVLDSQYRFVVATRNDTGPAVPNADETFVVTAHSPTPSLFGVSNAITGHSLDNLAPAAPLQLAGSMTGGSVALSWAANTENDLLGYAVYRGVGASFVPSAGTLVAQVSSPQHADPAYATGDWYKVTAVDRHGNESPVATLAPAQVTGVDGAPRVTVLNLDPNVPNPFNPSTTVWFDLPRPGGVNVGVYDLRGRVVRTLHTGALEAGRHHVEWDGRDTAGDPAAAGVYLLRLETADGEVRNRKMTLAK